MRMSLKLKIALIMVALSLLCAGMVGSVVLLKAWDNLEDLSMHYAKNASEASASNVEKFFEPHWFTTEAIGQIMEHYEDLPPDMRRKFFNSSLESIVRKNSEILGAWCNFEPNTLEGDDSQYINIPGTEPNGRFVPYWVRTS